VMRPVMSASGVAGGIESVAATCCRRLPRWAKTTPPGSARRRLLCRRGIAPPCRPASSLALGCSRWKAEAADGVGQKVGDDSGRHWKLPLVDAVALVSVISSAVVGLTGAGVAFYSTHRTARTHEKDEPGSERRTGT
jgi:hypothetical protein